MTMLQAFEMPKLSPSRRIPKWARTGFYNDETQEVFVPAALVVSEMEAVVMVGYDRTAVVYADKHFYVPTTWVAREWPPKADMMARIEADVRALYLEEAP
jgi:hypothetical protein